MIHTIIYRGRVIFSPSQSTLLHRAQARNEIIIVCQRGRKKNVRNLPRRRSTCVRAFRRRARSVFSTAGSAWRMRKNVVRHCERGFYFSFRNAVKYYTIRFVTRQCVNSVRIRFISVPITCLVYFGSGWKNFVFYKKTTATDQRATLKESKLVLKAH